MSTLLVLAAVLLGHAAGGKSAERQTVGPAPERRTFAVSSGDAWRVVQQRLKDMRLPVAELDRKHQALLTRWRSVGFSESEWLPALPIPESRSADRVRFLVFVSPFVEPAHVSVGCQLELRSRHGQDSRALLFNEATANVALMEEIARALGTAGLPVFEATAPDPCAQGARPGAGGPITPPEKIPLSQFEVPFPGPDLAQGQGGVVTLEMNVRADGGVSDLRVVGPPVGVQLEAAAMGAASLLLYAPPRIDGCPTRFQMTYTVRFRSR